MRRLLMRQNAVPLVALLITVATVAQAAITLVRGVMKPLLIVLSVLIPVQVLLLPIWHH